MRSAILKNNLRVLLIFTIVDVLILFIRNKIVGDHQFNFLLTNLSLGLVSLVIATLLYYFFDKTGKFLLILGCFTWLLFYPNAPYMITDIIHIDDSVSNIHSIFPITIITNNTAAVKTVTNDTSIANTLADSTLLKKTVAEDKSIYNAITDYTKIYNGLIIFLLVMLSLFYGFFSLKIMNTVFTRIFGIKTAWSFIVASVILSSFGVFLGRFQFRLESWQIFTHPLLVLRTIYHCLFPIKTNYLTYAFIFLFSFIQFSILTMMKDLEEPGKVI